MNFLYFIRKIYQVFVKILKVSFYFFGKIFKISFSLIVFILEWGVLILIIGAIIGALFSG